MRILVVDDHLDTLDLFSTLLEWWGHEVRAVGRASHALPTALELLPNVVFLDLGMPEMDGRQVARLMRQAPQLKGVILVAVTGFSAEASGVEEGEFDAHLMKPVDPNEFQSFLGAIQRRLGTS